jgi:hypothetical protein
LSFPGWFTAWLATMLAPNPLYCDARPRPLPLSALVFYTLATMHAVTSAGSAKARLEKTMSPAQIAAADKRVYAWQAKPEP